MTESRRVALVTGASRGIGRATAVAFARRGLDVALVGRPSPFLHDACEEVRSLGVAAESYPCDVTSEAGVVHMTEAVFQAMGVPEVVVNNAGIVRRGPRVEDTPVEDWDEVMAVNLRGPFLVSRAFLPAMRARQSGRLIFVASISSTIACPRNASYAASKWGLLGMVKSLAAELAGTPVMAAAVLPGSVDTDMLRGSGFEPAMVPSDVAKSIVFLGLDAPAALQGSALEMFG